MPRACADAFPPHGSVLERYAAMFDAVEINSTFYRRHRSSTFQRWAASVAPSFRFAVKVPRSVSHESRLRDCDAQIATFLADVSALGPRLGPLLLQLPPSQAFDPDLVGPVCAALATGAPSSVACEPRHASWFTADVDRWLAERRIARVAADPPRGPLGGEPGGWPGLAYWRLHGSPRIYYSAYPAAELEARAARIAGSAAPQTWCIFDNTATGAATADALALSRRVSSSFQGRSRPL